MQILVAVNTDPYSNLAIDQVARLAANTIAKVTILGIGSGEYRFPKQPTALPADQESTDPMHRAIAVYRDRFIGHFSRSVDVRFDSGLEAPDIRIRTGNASKEILSESREQQSDLIVLGCNDANGCTWNKGQNVPRQIASEADCSVYIAKKTRAVDRVVCCLGHEEISQRSLEMVSQFVTLYGARLQMVGLLERGELKSDIEKKLGWLISYYSAKSIEPWVEIVETRKFDDFVANEARYALMALWMGKEALLRRIYSKAKMNRLVKTSESSVLVLR
jgi:nucleotide-binding universal stress UspA family protein